VVGVVVVVVGLVDFGLDWHGMPLGAFTNTPLLAIYSRSLTKVSLLPLFE
jgi:hypothetical protein